MSLPPGFDPSTLPPGYLSENKGEPLYHVSIVFIVLQTIFITLFFISRYINSSTKGWDFWVFIPVAYIVCTAQTIIGILLYKVGGSGRRVIAVVLEDPNTLTTWLKLAKCVEYTHQLSIAAPKLAVLVFYARIFPSRGYRITFSIIAGLVVLTFVSIVLTSTLLCRPFAYNWDKTIPGGKCANSMAAYRFSTIPNLLTDLALLIAPLRAIYKLHVDLPVKIGLFVTFITGSIGTIMSINRLYQFCTIDLFADPTYNSVVLMIWTMAEPGTYLMAAIMLSLRPLFRKLFPNLHITKTIASRYKSRPTTGSWGNSSKNNNQIFRRRDIEIQNTKASVDDSLTNSTSNFNLQTHGYVELNELQDISPAASRKTGDRRGVV